jgi:aminoglycoside 6'-N-acetyltransferase
VIRPYGEADLPALLRILEQPEVARWWEDFDEQKLRKEVEQTTSAWVIEVDGDVAGYIQIFEEPDPDERHVDIDIFVAAEHHGHGVGPQAMREVLRICFEERGHHRAQLWTVPENARAIKAYEKVGFKTVGITRRSERRDGDWHDELYMDLLAEELT